MEKPVHTLSFSMSYPQYRDYYLYQISIAKNRPVWLVPELFLGAGVLGPWRPCFFAGWLRLVFTGFSIGYRNGFLDMCGCLLYRAAGMVVPNPRKARRQYRLKRLENKNRKFRLYQDFVIRSLSIGGI